MEFILFLVIVAVGVAFAKILGLQKRVERIEQELRVIRLRLGRAEPVASAPPAAAAEAVAPEVHPAQSAATQSAEPAQAPQLQAMTAVPPPPPPFIPPRLAKKPAGPSWEMVLGAQWMAWAGGVLLLVGVAYFMKYAYDNNWVDPRGRLAIGVLAGVIALVGAEVLRRRNYAVLFQAVTGAGIAIFYACVYFSLQVYALTGPAASFVMACMVTAGAIVLAVAHNAMAIAILGLVGGFLSPVLFGGGGNHPYILFSYVTVLDLVALGVAYFRRWRGLDILSFAGTILLYQAWHVSGYTPEQLAPALLFITVFYLLFLLIPTTYSLVRKQPEQWDGLTLVVANAVYALLAYYEVLYTDHQIVLGFVALGQALLVFLLARVWDIRIGRGTKTGESLLIIAMALVTLAIPLELKLYGIPIAWAVEGALFAYLGIRFDRVTCRIAAVGAIALAAGGLLYRLPLHPLPFTVILNPPFGSWLLVIAAAAAVAWQLRAEQKVLPGFAALTAYSLACVLLTLETVEFWIDSPLDHADTHVFNCLAILWAIIPAATLYAWIRKPYLPVLIVAYASCLVTAVVAFGGMAFYDIPSIVPAFNLTFLPKLAIAAAFWWMGNQLRTRTRPVGSVALNVAGHIVLAVLLARELERWSDATGLLSEKMALGLFSGIWALQALTLIWLGLIKRDKARRMLGLVFFVFILLKVVVFDAAQLEEVYRILSWILSGLVFLVGAYVYQRFSARLLNEPHAEGVEE